MIITLELITSQSGTNGSLFIFLEVAFNTCFIMETRTSYRCSYNVRSSFIYLFPRHALSHRVFLPKRCRDILTFCIWIHAHRMMHFGEEREIICIKVSLFLGDFVITDVKFAARRFHPKYPVSVTNWRYYSSVYVQKRYNALILILNKKKKERKKNKKKTKQNKKQKNKNKNKTKKQQQQQQTNKQTISIIPSCARNANNAAGKWWT